MRHFLVALSFVLVTVASSFAASVPDIKLDTLKAALADKSVTVLDANGPASYNSGHIPGAIDYFSNVSDLASKLPADKNALIVAYCYSPACPAYKQAADAATKLGYTNVQHFSPGISGWKDAGEPVQKGS